MSPVYPVFLSGWAALETVSETLKNYLILTENKGIGWLNPCHLQCKITNHCQMNKIRIYTKTYSTASR